MSTTREIPNEPTTITKPVIDRRWVRRDPDSGYHYIDAPASVENSYEAALAEWEAYAAAVDADAEQAR